MSPRTLIVTLEIEVEDVSDEERREGLFLEEGEEPDELDLPAPVAELEPADLAALLPAVITSDEVEMFAGSNIFANFTNARVAASLWKA